MRAAGPPKSHKAITRNLSHNTQKPNGGTEVGLQMREGCWLQSLSVVSFGIAKQCACVRAYVRAT